MQLTRTVLQNSGYWFHFCGISVSVGGKYLSILVALLAGSGFLNGCTDSPFGTGQTSVGRRQVRGEVALSNGVQPDGVLVWLEQFNLSTYTDPSGSFLLTLPPPETQGPPSGVTGAFSLYFYTGNYRLDRARTVVRDGEFLYSNGDIDGSGVLKRQILLEKLLEIAISVEPSTVSTNFDGEIVVEVALRAVNTDTVIVYFPAVCPVRTCGHDYRLGAVLFKQKETGEVFVFQQYPGADSRDIEIVTNLRVRRQTSVDFMRLSLPAGEYEVIPYLVVEDDSVPQELLQSLGSDVLQLSPEYARIPFKRSGDNLVVEPNPAVR